MSRIAHQASGLSGSRLHPSVRLFGITGQVSGSIIGSVKKLLLFITTVVTNRFGEVLGNLITSGVASSTIRLSIDKADAVGSCW